MHCRHLVLAPPSEVLDMIELRLADFEDALLDVSPTPLPFPVHSFTDKNKTSEFTHPSFRNRLHSVPPHVLSSKGHPSERAYKCSFLGCNALYLHIKNLMIQ
jgi:hypothetical protein